jgi:hypothetical protein
LELFACDVEALHFGVADLMRFWSDPCDAIGERPAAAVLRYVAEQPMLDPLPLRNTRRMVVDTDQQPRLGLAIKRGLANNSA